LARLAKRALWIGENRNHARRELLLYRGLRESENEPIHNLRRARAIAYVLAHYPVVVDPHDLLVGKLSTEPLTDGEAAELRDAGSYMREIRRGLCYGSGGTGGHRTVDFETLLDCGAEGILRQVEERAAGIDFSRVEHAEAACFYERIFGARGRTRGERPRPLAFDIRCSVFDISPSPAQVVGDDRPSGRALSQLYCTGRYLGAKSPSRRE